MKQSEIQEIINEAPTTIFNSNARYNGDFIVVGFVKESRSKYKTPMVYAQTKQVYFNEETKTTTISNNVQNKSLRIVSGVFSESIENYTTHKVVMAERSKNFKIAQEQNIDAMNQIKPELARLLKTLNIENKEYNFSTSATTFKIELDVNNANQLLTLLNTITFAKAGK
jgi:hypothetical protein